MKIRWECDLGGAIQLRRASPSTTISIATVAFIGVVSDLICTTVEMILKLQLLLRMWQQWYGMLILSASNLETIVLTSEMRLMMDQIQSESHA